MGLKDTHHVGRIVIHPRNPDIVYIAALGHLWGPNEERGLYKTVDGGKTWKKALYINADTGVADVAMDSDGRTVFAAAYQRRRRAWGFVGGGPHGALYRSLDGGDTWEKLAGGLPHGDVGRIGVEISKSHPNVVYAIYQHKNGGVFRSEDRGNTWTRMNAMNPRASYYSQIRIDPPEMLRARHSAGMAVNELLRAFDEGAKAVQAMEREVEGMKGLLAAQPNPPPRIQDALAVLSKKLLDLKEKFGGSGFGGTRGQIVDLAGQLQASTAQPTEAQMWTIDRLRADVTAQVAQLNAIITVDLPGFHNQLRDNGIAPSLVRR